MATYGTISSTGGQQYGQGLTDQIGSYTVQPGDTLSQIGTMFGIPWQNIYNANQNVIGGNPNQISAGQTYNIPGPSFPNMPVPGGPFGNSQNSGALQANMGPGSLSGTLSGTTVNTGGGAPSGGSGTYNSPTGGQPQPQQGGSTQIQNPGAVDLTGQNQQFAYTPEQQRILNNYETYRTQLAGLSSMVDQNYNSELAQINAQMQNLKNEQAQENDLYAAGLRQAGLTSGMSMFTPEIMKGEVKQAVDQGIAKLGALTTQQNGLIIAARKANISEKMDIIKQLKDIDTEKYAIAQKMKEDFYGNIKLENERVKTVVSENLPALYTQLRELPDAERVAKLTQYAQQLGIPANKMLSFYQEYDKQENKEITDMRKALMAEAPDVAWGYDDLYLTPAQFQKKLMSSPNMKNKLLSTALDNALRQAQINKTNAETNKVNAEASATSGSAAGLNPKQVSTFNSIVDKFNKSPLIAANDRAVILRDTAARLSKDPKNASLQVAFIYSMIQALDTYQSAVREGEIGFISGTQGLGDKIRNLPDKIANGSILSTPKVQQYLSTANMLTNSINGAAKKKAKTFQSQSNVAGIGPAFDEFLSESGYTFGTQSLADIFN